MNDQSQSLLCSMPTELIVKILVFVELPVILRCKIVCRSLRDVIDEAITLKYKIELVAAGMLDGPPSSLNVATRLDLLIKHQAAWEELNWMDYEMIQLPSDRSRIWKMNNGIYAAQREPNSISFRRFGSRYRNIKEKEWGIQDIAFNVFDFVMDTSQDLLVLVEHVQELTELTGKSLRLHARSLSSGLSHPLAPDDPMRHITFPGDGTKLNIQICGDYVGLQSIRLSPFSRELTVCNWQNGHVEVCLSGGLRSFSFLTVRHLVASVYTETDTSLRIFDFRMLPSETKLEIKDADYVCKYSWRDPARQYFLLVRCNFSPTQSYPPNSEVPFYPAPGNRLFMNFLVHPPYVDILYIPASVFLSHMARAVSGTKCNYNWEEFATEVIRVLNLPMENLRDTFIHGWKFIAPVAGARHSVFQVIDSNSLAARRSIARNNGDGGRVCAVQGTESCTADQVVQSSRPYRVKTLSLPESLSEVHNPPILHEDQIEFWLKEENQLCILTF